MAENYFTTLTKIGAALHANAQVTQTIVPWTHMALGDGGGKHVTPTREQTGLVREVHRLPITSIETHPENPNWIVAEAVVPSNVGGWTVRETAIMGTAGGAKCIAVGNCPETYKPVLEEGAVREMVVRMVVEISSAATVNLVIDPAVAIASRDYVDKAVEKAKPGAASTTEYGLVRLATIDEAKGGEEKRKVVTPEGLKAVLDESVGEAIAMARAYANVPTEFKAWVILVTSPHLRCMVWSTLYKKYVRAPWHQPGRTSHFLRDVPPGCIEIRSDIVLDANDVPDLADYLGIPKGAKFVLDEGRGEFLRNLDSGRGVDPGRTPGSWRPDTFREHSHGLGMTDSTAGNARYLAPAGSGFNFSRWSDAIKPEGGAETAPRSMGYRWAVSI